MSKLSQLQQEFTQCVADLIKKCKELGYGVSFGDAYRDPRVFGAVGERKGYGESSSCHKVRLAIDLNLFKDGEFLPSTEAHKELGEWWELQHPKARWGGRFNDGNHYSFEYEGMM